MIISSGLEVVQKKSQTGKDPTNNLAAVSIQPPPPHTPPVTAHPRGGGTLSAYVDKRTQHVPRNNRWRHKQENKLIYRQAQPKCTKGYCTHRIQGETGGGQFNWVLHWLHWLHWLQCPVSSPWNVGCFKLAICFASLNVKHNNKK